MPDLPIGGLDPIVGTNGTGVLADEQSGTTYKITLQEISDFTSANFNPGLVEGQAVYGGASGELKQSINFTFDESTQSIGAGIGLSITGNQCVGLGLFIGSLSGDNCGLFATTLGSISGNRSAAISGTSCLVESDDSLAGGRTARIFSGANGSFAFGQGIDVQGTAEGSVTFKGLTAGLFTITEPNSFNVSMPGNSQFETGATGTFKLGSVATSDYMEITNTGVNLSGAYERRKYIPVGGYDDAGTGSVGLTRPYDGITVWTAASGGLSRIGLIDVTIPFDFDPTVDIGVDLVWAPSTANAGNVVWEVAYSFLKPDGSTALDSNTATVGATLAASTNDEHPETHTFTLSTSTALPGDSLYIYVRRVGNDAADTYPNNVWITNVKPFYNSNKM